MADTPAAVQGTRTIELEVSVGAPPGAVRSVLTDPAELARWFPPIAEGSSELGGKLLISWGPSQEWRTTIAAVEALRHIRWVDDPTSPMAVDWTSKDAAARRKQNWVARAITWESGSRCTAWDRIVRQRSTLRWRQGRTVCLGSERGISD